MALAHSIVQFQDKIKVHLSEGNLNAALNSIHRLVDQIFCEPINTAQIFGSKLLDDLCQEIGALNLNQLIKDEITDLSDKNSTQVLESPVVYIASKLQASGGHTAVLADIIRLSPCAQSIILVTGINGSTSLAAIRHKFCDIKNLSIELAPRGKPIDKLNWLQRRILRLKPSDIWLFNHHQDSVAISAVQPSLGYHLHFYHHGDHHLCLGVNLEYADHVDIHPMGYHYCRNGLNIKNNRYLPMTVDDMGSRDKMLSFKSASELVTCTAAGFNKVEAPYFIQYVDVVPKLLQASGGRHIHIGRLTIFALWKIYRTMRRLGVDKSKFVYVPFVTSVWKALQQYEVDLYVTSFPYGGARTLIEAMGAGIPLAIHSHSTSRLLGTFDMVHEEAFAWRSPSELYDFVNKVDNKKLLALSKLARKRYLEYHSNTILKHALARHALPLQSPPLQEAYKPDTLQEALDISNQVSFKGVMWRFLYRSYRHLKSKWT